jgi:hypothetical protein
MTRRCVGLMTVVAACGATEPGEDDGGGADAAADSSRVDAPAGSCIVTREVRVSDLDGSSFRPSLAWDGAGYGVAWYDEGAEGNDIFFVRLDADGAPGAPKNLTEGGISDAAAVTATASGFAVAWAEFRDLNMEIFTRRLDPAGVPLADEVRVTETAGSTSTMPEVAARGDEVGVTWVETPGDGLIEETHAARILPSGEILDAVRLSLADARTYAPSIVADAEGYQVAWHDWRKVYDGDVYTSRLAPGVGEAAPERPVDEGPSDSFVPAIAAAGDGRFAVAWHDSRMPAWTIWFTTFTASGEVGEALRISDGARNANFASVAWNGQEWGLAWHERPDDRVLFVRLAADGTPIGEPLAAVVSPGAGHPSLVWAGDGWGMAWQDERHGAANYEIYFARVACD